MLLPFETHRERYALLDAINFARLSIDGKPITQARWKRLRTLLKVYNRLDRGDGCWAAVSTLAEQCECSVSAVSEAIRDAKSLGLLDLTPRARRSRNGGRTSNLARVRWERVAAMPYGQEVDSGLRKVDSGFREVDSGFRSAIEENSELSPSSRDGSSATEDFCSPDALSDRQLDAARHRLTAVLSALGRPRTLDDYELARKTVVLSFTRFSEAWLQGSLETVRRRKSRPKNPWSYWNRVLQESVRDVTGRELRVFLAKIHVPPALSPAEQIRERLCAASDPED